MDVDAFDVDWIADVVEYDDDGNVVSTTRPTEIPPLHTHAGAEMWVTE